jgi:hypothetical protein
MSATSALLQATANVPKRSYITTAAFAADFYTYTKSYNGSTYTWSGALTNSSANTDFTGSSYNAAGTIIHETGKKLYPDANPGITTYMVGVYHPVLGNGFIDPNSPKFAIYNSDKPAYIADGVDPNGSLVDQGQPVYTRGTVTAGGSISAGTTLSATTGLLLGTTAGAALVGTATVGGGGTVTVSTTAVTANSKIFLSYIDVGAAATPTAIAYVSAQTTGTSFVITGTANSTVNWFIIN